MSDGGRGGGMEGGDASPIAIRDEVPLIGRSLIAKPANQHTLV